MQGRMEIMGNVYFPDFARSTRIAAAPATGGEADPPEPADDVGALMVQINATAREIADARAQIAHQASEQSRYLLSMVHVINDIAGNAGAPDASRYEASGSLRELARDARDTADQLLGLLREQVAQSGRVAHRLAEVSQRNLQSKNESA